MAYKFQLQDATMSGSLTQEGDITISNGGDAAKGNLVTTGKVLVDVLGTDINAAGSMTFGNGQQGGIYAEATGLVLDAKTGLDVEFHVAGTKVAHIDDDGMDLVAGDAYQIAGTSVLNATTLGGAVVGSSLTSVGALAGGSIAAGFGAISTGNDITTTAEFVIDADGTGIGAAGALTMGADQDASVYWDGGSLVLDTKAASDIAFEVAGTEVASLDSDGLNLASGDTYQINGTAVLSNNTLGSGVTNSSLTSLGAAFAGTAPYYKPIVTGSADDVNDSDFLLIKRSADNSVTGSSIDHFLDSIAGAGLNASNGQLVADGASAPSGYGDVDRLGGSALSEGFSYGTAQLTANRKWQLPANPSAGDIVRVKAPSDVQTFYLEVTCGLPSARNQKIDGQNFIRLESDGAAVSLIWLGNVANTWGIF